MLCEIFDKLMNGPARWPLMRKCLTGIWAVAADIGFKAGAARKEIDVGSGTTQIITTRMFAADFNAVKIVGRCLVTKSMNHQSHSTAPCTQTAPTTP